MAKMSAASLLLLFAALHQGSALYCYESTCLGGDTNINICVNNNRTVKKECTYPGFRQVLNKLQSSGGTVQPYNTAPTAWTCLKHEIRGTQGGQPASVELRLCYPKTTNACEEMKMATKGLNVLIDAKGSDVCSACDSDACNPASRHAATSVVALVAAAVLPLMLLRH